MTSSCGSGPIEPISWLKVSLDSIGFKVIIRVFRGLDLHLAFFVQTFWQNNRILIREITQDFVKNLFFWQQLSHLKRQKVDQRL